MSDFRLVPILTQILDDTTSTAWGSRDAGITAVQDQQMVRILPEFFRDEPEQLVFDLIDVLARRDTGSI